MFRIRVLKNYGNYKGSLSIIRFSFCAVFSNVYNSYNVHTSWLFISQTMYRSNRMNTPQGSFSTISQALCSQGITTEYLTALLPSSQRQKGNHTNDFLTYKLSKEQIAAKYGIPTHTSEYTSKFSMVMSHPNVVYSVLAFYNI